MITNLKEFRKSVVARTVEHSKPDISEELSNTCVSVRIYAEYMFIEALSDGQFSLTINRESYVDTDIKRLEKIMWYDFAMDELLANTEWYQAEYIKAQRFYNQRSFNSWLATKTVKKIVKDRYVTSCTDWLQVMTKKELKQYFYETYNR